MAVYEFLQITGKYEVLVTDGPDAGNEPDKGIITGLVTFHPEVTGALATEAMTPEVVAILQPIVGRIEEDGVLRSIDGSVGVKIVANNAALALPELRCRVEYSAMKWDKMERHLDGFTFVVPTSAGTKDIRQLFKERVQV